MTSRSSAPTPRSWPSAWVELRDRSTIREPSDQPGALTVAEIWEVIRGLRSNPDSMALTVLRDCALRDARLPKKWVPNFENSRLVMEGQPDTLTSTARLVIANSAYRRGLGPKAWAYRQPWPPSYPFEREEEERSMPTVVLRDGRRVDARFVVSTELALEALRERSSSTLITLLKLSQIGERMPRPGRGASPSEVALLKNLGLLESDGFLQEDVRSVVLNAAYLGATGMAVLRDPRRPGSTGDQTVRVTREPLPESVGAPSPITISPIATIPATIPATNGITALEIRAQAQTATAPAETTSEGGSEDGYVKWPRVTGRARRRREVLLGEVDEA